MKKIRIIEFLFQNNYQQDDTFRLSFISELVVLHTTCFELQGAHHQEFHFFTVQAASGILCNLLLYCTRSPTCSVPDCIISIYADIHVFGLQLVLSTCFVIPDCCICFVQLSFDIPILIYFFGLLNIKRIIQF